MRGIPRLDWTRFHRILKLMVAAILLSGMALKAVYAADFRPFDNTIMKAIEQKMSGRPFILAFWSVDCAYCAEDLAVLGEAVRARPALTLLTVCTDNPARSQQAAAVLDSLQLPAHERWQFAEQDEERLRYRIDKTWYGELPRTYFYNAKHQIEAVSGRPDPIWLKAWLKRSVP